MTVQLCVQFTFVVMELELEASAGHTSHGGCASKESILGSGGANWPVQQPDKLMIRKKTLT